MAAMVLMKSVDHSKTLFQERTAISAYLAKSKPVLNILFFEMVKQPIKQSPANMQLAS